MEIQDMPFNNLFNAINNGNIDEIQAEIRGISFNINSIENRNGDSPITCAARKQNVIACEMLINNYGASTIKKDKNGRTTLMEIVRCRGEKWNSKIANLFWNSVNEQDNDGRTALMFAVQGAGLFGSRRGNIKITNQLIEMGADTTIKDSFGKTALHWAIHSNDTNNNEKIISFLKEAMLSKIAIDEFKKNYLYNFDCKGNLTFQRNK